MDEFVQSGNVLTPTLLIPPKRKFPIWGVFALILLVLLIVGIVAMIMQPGVGDVLVAESYIKLDTEITSEWPRPGCTIKPGQTVKIASKGHVRLGNSDGLPYWWLRGESCSGYVFTLDGFSRFSNE